MNKKSPANKNLNVLDLFAGAGGLSYGLQLAGCNVIAGIDKDADCKETFLKNHPNSKYLTKDIKTICRKDIYDIIGKNNIDIIVGGPPCQGFSISGKRIEHDPRNQLYNHFLKIIDVIKPQAVLVENVPGLRTLFNGTILDDLLTKLQTRRYNVNVSILSSERYGVPQARKRIFIVGIKGEHYRFPKPSNKQITLWDAISDLPLLNKNITSTEYRSKPKNKYQEFMRKESNHISNHTATKHTKQTKRIISMVPEGKNYKALPKHLQKIRNVHIAWTRLDSSKPSLTIDTGHRHHFHPKANRVPTVRESARIQSFPDNFRFFGNKTSQYRQVGNAVPPLLALKLGERLLETLGGNHV